MYSEAMRAEVFDGVEFERLESYETAIAVADAAAMTSLGCEERIARRSSASPRSVANSRTRCAPGPRK